MPATSQVLGPGTLTVGAGEDQQGFTAQVTNMRIAWSSSVSAGEVIDLLDGSQLKDEDTVSYSAELAGNLVQDFSAAGTIEWSWAHKGEAHVFEFIPNTDAARKIVGTVRVGPIDLGGDVKKRNRSDISWPCTVDPALSDVV